MSVDPEKAARLLSEHFDALRDDEFVEHAREWSPELIENEPDQAIEVLQQLPLPDTAGPHGTLPLELARPVPRQVELRAYLASGLTGLDETQRQLVFALSDAV